MKFKFILPILLLIILSCFVSADLIDYTTNNQVFYSFKNATNETIALNDWSDNGYDLTNSGATFNTTYGFSCDGSNDVLIGTNNTNLDLETLDFVICAWVKHDNQSIPTNYFVSKRNGGDGYFMGGNVADKFTFYGGTLGDQFVRTTNDVITPGSMELFCSVLDRSSTAGNKVYVDAVSQSLSNNVAGTTNLTDPTDFEICRDYSDNYFSGDIGALYVWKGVGIAQTFNSSVITEIYNNGEEWNPYDVPGDTYFEKAFVDTQESNVSFIANNNYFEILTASIYNEDGDANSYGDTVVQMYSDNEVNVTCKIEVNGNLALEESRTNLAGTFGSLDLLTANAVFLQNVTYNFSLQCKKSGTGTVTILNSVSIAHYLPYDVQYSYHNSTQTGVTYADEVFESQLITANYTGYMITEWANIITNNQGITQEVISYIAVNGTQKCANYPRGINANTMGSIGGSCSFPVTQGETYNISMFMTATNIDITHKGHIKTFTKSDSINITTGLINDTPTKLAELTFNNIWETDKLFLKVGIPNSDSGHDSYFYFNVDGVNTTLITKTSSINNEVLMMQKLENINPGLINASLWGYSGSISNFTNITGGDFIIYPLYDFNRTLTSFQITAYDIYNNASISDFSAEYDDLTFSTTTGLIQIFTFQDYLNLTITAPNYFGRLIFDHDTNTNLNQSLYPGIINLTSPDNDTIFNVNPTFSFYYNNSLWKGITCDLYDNRTGSFTSQATVSNVGPNVITTFGTVPTITQETTINWYISCENGNYVSETRSFIFDNTDPIITFNAPLETNGSYYLDDFNLDIIISDNNNYEANLIITDPNGSTIMNNSYNTSGFFNYSINDLVSLTTFGEHTLFLEAADGHTKNEIEYFKVETISDGIKFNDELIIRGYNADYAPSAIKKVDRYSLMYIKQTDNVVVDWWDDLIGYDTIEKTTADSSDKFLVEIEDGTIDIVENSDYTGHLIIKKGSNYKDWYWVDFENANNLTSTVERISGNKVVVSLSESDSFEFNSVGRLNVINQTVTFIYNTDSIFLTTTYEPGIVTGFETSYTMTATIDNNLIYNNASKSAYIFIDSVQYTPIQTGSSGNNFYYSYDYFVPESFTDPTLDHQWIFNTVNKFGETVQSISPLQSQNVFNITMSECDVNNTFEVINFSYYDEINDSALSIDVTFDLIVTDGTYNYPVTFSDSATTSNTLCTNLDPDDVLFNFDLYGTITMAKTNYSTRVFTISPDNAIEFNNNETINQSLYLISLANSQSVNYNWLTTDYDLINGVMEVYRCRTDGTKDLVASTLISNGVTNADIELFTGVYYYNVVYQDILYDSESFSICHVEVSDDITYYVPVLESILPSVSGLLFVSCGIDQTDNLITMNWGSNTYSTEPITGCLQVYRPSLFGYDLYQEVCSERDTGSLLLDINESEQQQIKGKLVQGNATGYCNDVINIGDEQDSGEIFGPDGLFSLLLFVIAMSLYFSGDSILSLAATGLAVLLGFIFGLTSFGWEITSAIILFIMLIAALIHKNRRS